MSVSSSRNSGTIQIDVLNVTSDVKILDNIHNVSGTITFNANVNLSTGITVEIRDDVLNTEEDITSSLSIVSAKTLGYSFSYSTGNSNIEILTPKQPTDTASKHSILVTFNGNTQTILIDLDSCLKYFQNSGGFPPAFTLATYDFNTTMNFDFESYVVDFTDRLKMYCNGIPSGNGIREDFTTYGATPTGSTPTLLYDITTNISGLSAKTYNLSSSSDILIEIEKVGFSQNQIYSIVNAESSQDLIVYMDKHFNQNPITYSSAGETHIVNYKLFNPVWKDILIGENVLPVISTSGQISGAIVSIVRSNISNSNAGEIDIAIEYKIDDLYTSGLGKSVFLGTNNSYTGVISISVGSFTMDTGELTWNSVVT